MDVYFRYSKGMPDCVWLFVADFILPDCLRVLLFISFTMFSDFAAEPGKFYHVACQK